MRLCRESKIVAGLCLVDLITTIILIRGHGAAEANIVMRFYLEHGLAAFIGAKCLLFVPALLIAEWYRHRNPGLITGTLRLVICLYVGLYSVGVYTLNRGPDKARPTEIQDWQGPVIGSQEELPSTVPLTEASSRG